MRLSRGFKTSPRPGVHKKAYSIHEKSAYLGNLNNSQQNITCFLQIQKCNLAIQQPQAVMMGQNNILEKIQNDYWDHYQSMQLTPASSQQSIMDHFLIMMQ